MAVAGLDGVHMHIVLVEMSDVTSSELNQAHLLVKLGLYC